MYPILKKYVSIQRDVFLIVLKINIFVNFYVHYGKSDETPISVIRGVKMYVTAPDHCGPQTDISSNKMYETSISAIWVVRMYETPIWAMCFAKLYETTILAIWVVTVV